MLDHLLRHLRLICKLLASLDRTEPERSPSRYVRVYGLPRGTSYRVYVTVQPIYPDHEQYRPIDVIRAKSTRLQIARLVEDEISNRIVGYKVKVRIENV